MNILAFDFGIKTGWASLKEFPGNRSVLESGVQEFPLNRGESSGMRFLRFNSWLDRIFELVEPNLAVYETAHHRGGYATELLVGMATRLQERCAKEKADFPVMAVHSMTLKKQIAGTGKANKEDMVRIANEKFGIQVKDDNEADALLLLEYARRSLK